MAQRPTSQTTPPEDATNTYVNATCLDLLLIELVPMAYRIAADLAAKEEAWLATKRRSLNPKRHSRSQSQPQSQPANANNATTTANAGGAVQSHQPRDGTTSAPSTKPLRKPKPTPPIPPEDLPLQNLGIGHIGGTAPGMDEDELRESVFHRLDSIGYRVGLGLTEHLSRDRPRPTDPLDTIKFVCKDLWTLVFRKQIDNLKTNHRGVFVLTDNNFRGLGKVSLEKGRDAGAMMAQAQPFLFFPAGVIRGALSSLGVQASVAAESGELPGVTFQIRTVGSKP